MLCYDYSRHKLDESIQNAVDINIWVNFSLFP